MPHIRDTAKKFTENQTAISHVYREFLIAMETVHSDSWFHKKLQRC
jgi:hypothetical protein